MPNGKFSGGQGEKAYARDKETLDSGNNVAARPCLSTWNVLLCIFAIPSKIVSYRTVSRLQTFIELMTKIVVGI
jgi:hypothetical protein